MLIVIVIFQVNGPLKFTKLRKGRIEYGPIIKRECVVKNLSYANAYQLANKFQAGGQNHM